ncbi:MAG: hypothetical protein K6T57_14290 [Thermaceae bacterium]|nr:hypothetical protein [Thermaceae bacterium]
MLSLLLVACGGTRPNPGPGPDPAPNPGPTQAAPFFLPTPVPENTTDPTVETDAKGNVHFVYAKYARGDAFYAFCPDGCKRPQAVRVVRLETQGTVDEVMLALDRSGKPHVLMSTYLRVYYARCTGDCTQPSGWQSVVILEHNSSYQVSGEAFALDPQDRPRFLMHSYVTPFAQRARETFYVACDTNCLEAQGWQAHKIEGEQLWQAAQLRFDPQGRPRAAVVASVKDQNGTYTDVAAYVECNTDCTAEGSWKGTGLAPAYANLTAEIPYAVSMALTAGGAPRVAFLAKLPSSTPALLYFACERDCTNDNWKAINLLSSQKLDAGLDLALDKQDRPRVAFSVNANIGLAHCRSSCAEPNADWPVAKVEFGSEMKPDQVFPYPGCNVAAWFLRHPSLSIAPDGSLKVAYQALDISGGGNPQHPCDAGPDMTFSRFAPIAPLP